MSQNMVFFGRFMSMPFQHIHVLLYANDDDEAFLVDPEGVLQRLGNTSLLSEVLGVEIPVGLQTQTSSSGRKALRDIVAWAQCNPDMVGIVTRPLPYILADWDGADAKFTYLGAHTIELSGWDFSRVHFTGADFRGTTLTGLKFGNVENARFEGATLRNVDASGANLSKANFSGATISGGSFAGANLTGAIFSGDPPATFRENVDFTGANLELADFTGTSLMPGEVTMGRPKFGTSVDRRTILARARVHTGFLDRDWSCLDCAGATIVFDPAFDSDELVANFAILTAVNFAGRSLAGAQFKSAVLHGAHFANCNLDDATFQGALLGASNAGGTAADFSGARLGLADFSDADLSGVGFSGASLKGAKFTNALLLTTDFSNAFVADADFIAIRDRRMQGVSFNNACLVSASFRGTNVTRGDSGRPTSFANALLLGADFTGATLAEATLTNAKLASKTGTITVILAQPPETIVMTYEATQLRPEATGPHTRCPDGAGGPCSRERLITPGVPDTWRQPALGSIEPGAQE
jgi:uncharacterized protein YjbI with pentapeptide repeats